jgi:glucosamine-6-phosphate deaminase
MVATGNSQIALMDALTRQPIHWKQVDVFHMDEYLGISRKSFRQLSLLDQNAPGR